jgi:hypothetical protein
MGRPKVSAASGPQLFTEFPAQSQYRARVPILVPGDQSVFQVACISRVGWQFYNDFSVLTRVSRVRAAARPGRALFAAACCSIKVFKINHRLWKTLTGVQFRTHVMEPGVLVLPGRAPTEFPARRSSTAHNDGLSSRRRPSWGRHFVRIRQNERWPQHSQSGRRCKACVCRGGLASQYCAAIKID